jgi:hypothetical protein
MYQITREVIIMKTYFKYYLHITEPDGTEYDFQAYFDDHMVADKFMTENENEGNKVLMVAPFWEEVQMNPEDLPKC